MSRKRKCLSQMTIEENEKRKRIDQTINSITNNNKNQHKQMRVGTILHMTLKNFMCHSLLEVKFDHNINFISGRNGSGKSAILTALVVGFGAKATVTNRGANIKGFIKAGKSSGSVEIVLNNYGTFAYRPNIYGNTISIQRTFNASGGSTYKIKAASGQVVSTSARDIKNISQALNIQIDNPVCILNQDTSRNFLNTSDPKMKYNLFNRATRLDLLYEEYKQGGLSRDTTLNIYEEKKEALDKAAKEMQELHERIENHKNIKKLKVDLAAYQNELLWSKVLGSEKELEEHQKMLDEIKEHCEELEMNTKNKQQQLKVLIEKMNENKRKIQELQENSEAKSRPVAEQRKTLRLLKQEREQKIRERNALLKSIKSKEREMDVMKDEIENYTTKLSQAEQKRLENLRIITDFKEKVKEMSQMYDTYQNDVIQSNGDVKQKEEQMQAVSRKLHDYNTKYNVAKENLRIIKEESDNPLAPYGKSMVKLVNVINSNEHKFKEKPRGPLGAYVSVKNKKWSTSIEGFISKPILFSFCCDNKKDCDLLLSIISQVWESGPKPTIITSKFFHKVHDVRRNLVQKTKDGCISIFEAIKVSDPVVMNCLIDQLSIESILLIPNSDRAIELLSNASNVPKNCSRGVTIKGDLYFPDPNYKMYGSKYHTAKILQVDTADLINHYENELTEQRESIMQTERKLEEIRTNINRIKTQSYDVKAKMEHCKRSIDKTKSKIISLQTSMDIECESGSIHQLEQEMQDLKRDKLEMESQVENFEDEIKELESKETEIKDNLKELEDYNNDFEQRMAPLENEIREYHMKREELQTDSEFDQKRLAESRKKIQAVMKEHRQFQDTVDLHTKQARSLGERVENPRPVPTLVDKINSIKQKIKRMDTEDNNVDVLKALHQEKSAFINGIKETMDIILLNLEELTLAYDRRKRHCRNTRDYFGNFMVHCFKHFLKMRQFKGSLNINFNEKTIDMIVIPQQGTQGITEVKNLSGGEKSFSTVAFLYSLWQCLDFPFYFLDEFDVFMDKANRTKVMEILIHHAKLHPDKQFVFLTPQDVSFVNDHEVAIHRLEDPVRTLSQQ